MRRLLPFALLLAAAAPGHAQVYRCGNGYSQQPCTAGVEIAVVKQQPTREEAARAVAVAKADAQRADAMERDRLAQEAKAPKAIVLDAPRPAASVPLTGKSKGKHDKKATKDEQFIAVSPAPAKKAKN